MSPAPRRTDARGSGRSGLSLLTEPALSRFSRCLSWRVRAPSAMRERTNPIWTSKGSLAVLDAAASGDSSGASRRHLLP